jgi:hypothetical protein
VVAAEIVDQCPVLLPRRQAQAGAVVQVAEQRGEGGVGEVERLYGAQGSVIGVRATGLEADSACPPVSPCTQTKL